MSTGWIVLGVIVVIAFIAFAAYNRLVALSQRVNQAFADIDVQLKQRHDLIPNLVETVKGYAQHERGTLDDVIKARNAAMSAQGSAQVSAAENQLSGALGRLIALSEAYPDLKANANFQQLQSELSDIENKIAASRRFFNNAVQEYNTGIQQLPAALFAGTGRLRMSIEALEASLPQSLAHYFAMGLPGVLIEADGRVYHNAGATEAQELGGMLASAVSYLRMFEEARQPLVYAAPHIGFSLSVDQDQLMSMAKIRALRILWARVQEACSIEASPCAIHAETSYRMMTLKDPETNILRSTIAAFAAAAGGADSIAVLPHTIAHGLPDGFARRIARNTQLILQHESHAGFVTDPGAGSGSIETLTDELCASAWEEFQRIEVEGGVLASLAAGHIQDRVEAAAARRAELYRSGERAIIGTTLFPAAEERPVKVLDGKRDAPVEDGAASCRPLPPRRIDEAIEASA